MTDADGLATSEVVIEWDRRNTGAADVWFGRSSEQTRWADDLVRVLEDRGTRPRSAGVDRFVALPPLGAGLDRGVDIG